MEAHCLALMILTACPGELVVTEAPRGELVVTMTVSAAKSGAGPQAPVTSVRPGQAAPAPVFQYQQPRRGFLRRFRGG